MSRLFTKSWLFRFIAAFLFAFAATSATALSSQTKPQILAGLTGSTEESNLRNLPPLTIPKPTFSFKISEATATPQLAAKAFLISDLNTLTPIYSKQSTISAEPASTTKIATAIVALNTWSLDKNLIVPSNCLGVPASIGLQAGEVLSLKSLLYAMLMNSASDATCTIYTNFGGQQSFVGQMNILAAKLGLKSTQFGNPIGFDTGGSWVGNTSTATDLSIITKEALKNSLIKEIVASKSAVVTSADGQISHQLNNTNLLLNEFPEVFGVKTGTTDEAGQCLITAFHYNNKDFLIVLLGSSDRFGETKTLINWFRNAVEF